MMKSRVLALIPVTIVGLFALRAFAEARIVEFHIPAGTDSATWNTQDTLIELSIGDTLRIVNDDSVPHALHTDDGQPCEHGTEMAPHGGTVDCVIGEPYNALQDGPLYDHNTRAPALWLVAQ